jgi:hypothetical protein
MATQNFDNHARFVPMYHFVLSTLLVLTLIGSLVNLYRSFGDHERLYSAALIVVLAFCSCVLFYYVRTFPLKAQDRAIRAEENLRHFVMSGKLFDPRLTMSQIIALRFASDEEFVELARRAAESNMTAAAIKRAVKNWRADNYRV